MGYYVPELERNDSLVWRYETDGATFVVLVDLQAETVHAGTVQRIGACGSVIDMFRAGFAGNVGIDADRVLLGVSVAVRGERGGGSEAG
jgi:hypothetical protein